MLTRAFRWPLQLIREGKTAFLFAEIWMRVYKQLQEFLFSLRFRLLGRLPKPVDASIHLETKHPIAFESPDHIVPWGTGRDNSTNKKFVTVMHQRLSREAASRPLASLDLGCSGGQLVRDFKDLGWIAVGLEGSDFSLKHRRANWPELAGKNLFTCDVTKPFRISLNGQAGKFNLVTMWEVLEHIHPNDLPQLFTNIIEHMAPGGYFIASTTSDPDIHDGIDLHQTKWRNSEWKTWLNRNFPQLEPVELGLKYYQFVRHNEERSFLTCRRRLT